jgi:hypothetical protein
MTSQKIMYGLSLNRKGYEGELLHVWSRGNQDDSCSVSVGHELTTDPDCLNVWLVPSLELAKKAAMKSTPWYNASYNTPENRYAGECKVVKVTISMEVL